MSAKGNGGNVRRRGDDSKSGKSSAGRNTSGRSASARASSTGRRSGGAPPKRSNQRPPARGAAGGRRPARPRIRVPEGTPGIGVSLARGLLTTMTSIPLVVLTIASTLVLWGAFAAIGAGSSPPVMAQYLALPPVRSLLVLSFLNSAASIGGGGGGALAGFLVLILFDAFFALMAISLAASALTGVGPRAALARTGSLLRRRIGRLFLLEAGFVSVTLVGYVLGAFFAAPALILAIVAILYLGAFVEPAAALDDRTPRESVRASFEVSKLLRNGHSAMVAAYIGFLIVLWVVAPGRSGVATPTVAVWVYALVGALLNVSFLSAFVHRWLVLRRLVLPDADDEPAPPNGAAGTPESETLDA